MYICLKSWICHEKVVSQSSTSRECWRMYISEGLEHEDELSENGTRRVVRVKREYIYTTGTWKARAHKSTQQLVVPQRQYAVLYSSLSWHLTAPESLYPLLPSAILLPHKSLSHSLSLFRSFSFTCYSQAHAQLEINFMNPAATINYFVLHYPNNCTQVNPANWLRSY